MTRLRVVTRLDVLITGHSVPLPNGANPATHAIFDRQVRVWARNQVQHGVGMLECHRPGERRHGDKVQGV